jgi:hypothetical protein
MLALTIHRPYPYAILHLDNEMRKPVENRGWKPPMSLIGQRLAIHAGKVVSDDGLDEIAFRFRTINDTQDAHLREFRDPSLLALGIVGTVVVRGWLVWGRNAWDYIGEVGHVQPGYEDWAQAQADTEWFTGPYGWLLDEPRPLKTPIACRGAQGLWRVSPEHVAEIERQEAA